MAKKSDNPRVKLIAERLEGHIADGEMFSVEGEPEGVRVQLAEDGGGGRVSPLMQDRPELYGRLLAANEVLDRAGSLTNKVLWLAGVALCAVVATGCVDSLFGVRIEKLQVFWVYVLIGAATLFVTNRVAAFFEAIAFSRLKERVYRAVDDAGHSPAELLSLIEGDGRLDKLSPGLKRDVAKSSRKW